MEHLTASKVTTNGRISLGQEAMRKLGLSVGDRVLVFEDKGRVSITKITPPS